MKRIGAIISLSMLIVLLASSLSFATGLTLVSTYPEDGEGGLQAANVAIKMIFSENMTGEQAKNANTNGFKITNAEGETIDYDVLYNAQKYPNEIWLQITENLVDNMEYTVKISEDLQSTAGNSLDEEVTLKFSTRDTSADSNGYMVLMVLMVVGMVVFTAWDTKRNLKKESGETEEDKKVNPYKEAKKTGKSVEEIIAKTEQEKAQAEKRKAKAGKKQSVNDKTEEATDVKEGVKKVKQRKPISAIGIATPAKIVAKRAAFEEAKEKEKAKTPQTNAKKGSKQQQKKKK